MRRSWWSFVRLISLSLALLAGLSLPIPTAAQGPHVDVLTVNGVITPVVADYLAWGIRTAAQDGAVAVIIQMDTPGGLAEATWTIVRAISNAEVPVVVYVSPQGARAASAGVYITYASHVAAMAPKTRIGAATPVSIGDSGQVEELVPEMKRKVEEDAMAGLRASAQAHGRNVDWAERAVREAASATANEALDLGVVEIIADDMGDLLGQLDGRTVALASGRQVTLRTAGVAQLPRPMSFISRFLTILTDPTVAYLLLGAGLLGLWVEISHPGVSLPGLLGGVCIVLGLYGMGTLQVNWAGVLLVVFAFVLFAFDLFAPTHFVLTTGGVVALLMGSLLLLNSSEPYLRVEPWAIATLVGVVVVLVTAGLILAVRRLRRFRVSGVESLVGQVGVVRQELAPDGFVFVDGALWKAQAEDPPLPAGTPVEVLAVEGLLLRVRRHQP